MNQAWPTLRYHPVQAQLWQYEGRFAAVVAGRRSGKTEVSQRKLITQLPIKKPWPDPLYFYVLPTRDQAKRTVWYKILQKIPKKWLVKDGANLSDLSITTIFGSKLYIIGADKPHRLEGVGADFVIIDESSDQRPDLYTKTISPMLADRAGKCWRIGVPKRTGIGRADFKSFFDEGLKNNNAIASFHWKSADILSSEEIALQRSQMDELTFREQFEASWIDIGASVYYSFTSENISIEVRYDPSKEIYIGCDFNVSPMAWVLGHYIDGKLYIFDEVFMRDTNTQKTLDYLWSKYREHLAGWRFFGDASSRAKHTSAVRSDYLTIKNDARLGQKKVFFPKRNPHIRDRVASVNKALCDATGIKRIFISPNCKHLINDLNSVSYKEGTSVLEDYSGTDIGHASDAFGYIVHSLMPIRIEVEYVPAVWSAA